MDTIIYTESDNEYVVEQAVLIIHGYGKGMFRLTLAPVYLNNREIIILLTGEQFDKRVRVIPTPPATASATAPDSAVAPDTDSAG